MTATAAADHRSGARRVEVLVPAALLFAAAVLLHNGDHARRGGDSVTADVFWVGTAAILLEVGVVVLVLQRNRLAALAAVSAGLGLAAGYVLVHVLPGRSWLSDPLFDGGASALSQAAALLEIAAATALGIAGLVEIRRRGGLAASASGAIEPARPLGAALAHPAVVALILGNAVIVVVSLATR